MVVLPDEGCPGSGRLKIGTIEAMLMKVGPLENYLFIQLLCARLQHSVVACIQGCEMCIALLREADLLFQDSLSLTSFPAPH